MCQPSFQHSQTNTRKHACAHVPLCVCLRIAACMSSQHAVLHNNRSYGHESELIFCSLLTFMCYYLPSLLCNACTLMTAGHCGGRYVQTAAYAGNEQHPRQQRLAADKARRQVSQNSLYHASVPCQQQLPHMAQSLLTVHIHSIAGSHCELYSGTMQCRLKSLW